MQQEKELEIRLMFLEETNKNLNTIESAILRAAIPQSNHQQWEAVTRAAHSIKGGAAMMGFQALSDRACCLEDLFRILKTQQKPVELPLKNLLQAAVERLRQLIDINLQEKPINQQWLDGTQQIFDELQQFKSDHIPGNVVVDLLPEDGEIIIKAIFETEVEGYLQRLESLLADPEQHCLDEEISIVALELGGLGEMLELPAFKSLCESVNQHLEANPEQVEGIGHLALQGWRRSQELLLIGQADKLPKQIDLSDLAELSVDVEIVDNFPELQDKSLHSVLTETLTEPTSSINDKNYQDSFSIEKLQEIFSEVEELIIEHKRLRIEHEHFGLKLGQLRSSLIPFIAKPEKREVSGQASPFFSERQNAFQNGSFSYHEVDHKNPGSNFETSDLELESNGLQKNKEPKTPQNHKKTILVVDDAPLVHEFLSITLKKANYGIELAKDGLQALQKLNDKKLHISAVICDIDMPNLDGLDFLVRIKSDNSIKHLPVTMLTSHTEELYRNRAELLGASAYFSKPYNEEELLKTLKELV